MAMQDPAATGLDASITSFVPDLALSLEAGGSSGVVAERDAVLMLADISGFTRLARAYAQRGPDGAERLSARLNECFGELVDTVLAHGGDIANFAGDAFLAIFTDGEGAADAAHRAVACGLAAQARMARHARAADPITMRLGVAAGPLAVLRLGGVADRWELVLSGEVVARVADLERVAPAGAVVVGPEVWARLPADAVGDIRVAGPVRVREVPPLPAEPAVRPAATAEDRRHLMGFLPRAIVARLLAGQGAWLAELRTATTLFAALPHAAAATAGAAQALTVDLQKAIYDSEGSVVKLIVDNKGLLLFCAFGLPPVSHADDALRAVTAALAVSRVLAEHGCPAAVGVATGPVFCGSIGNDRRRDYTLLGDTVNRSARLMQQAGPGREVLCDEATRIAAGRAVRFLPAEPYALKGTPEPVLASVPVGPADRSARLQDAERLAGHGEPLVGRGAELAELAGLLDGPGRIAIVEGEAGIGKTRVLEAFAEQAAGRGRRCLFGAADALQRSTPYGAWRPVLRAVLGPGDDGLAGRVVALGGVDAAVVPLLGPLLGVDVPQSGLTVQMSAEERADSTVRLVADLLRAAAAERPLLIVLDDVQWLDSASWLLVRRLLRTDADLLLAVACRTGPAATPAELAPLLAATPHLRLQLRPLPDAAGEALVADCLGATTVPAALSAFIRDRAGGHPFYRRELALALREAGAVEVDADGEARITSAAGLEALEVPATVAGLVASRIERLPPDQQLTLKVASVVGRSFLTRTVGTVHPLPEDRPRVPSQLERLAASAITALEAPPPESAYAFSHAITHEITYNLMTFGQRRELHGLLAAHYEQAGGPGDAAGVALHWERADQPVRALPHLVEAGRTALDAGAYGEAVELLERALAIDATAHPDGDAFARARLLALAGQASLSVGRTDRALEHHLRALELLERPFPATTLRVHAGLAREAARQVAGRIRGGPRPLAGLEAERSRLASRSLEDVMQIVFHEEDAARTGYCVLRVLNLCESVPGSPQLARAFAAVEPLVGFAGLRRTADRYAALSAAALGPQTTPGNRGLAAEYEAIYAATIGDWARAEERLETALVQLEQVGSARRTLECRSLLGIVALLRGDVARAGLLREQLYRSAVAAEDRQVVAWALCERAEVAIREGRPDDAIAVLDLEATALVGGLGRSERLWLHGTLAEAHLRRGDRAAAHVHARRAQAQAPFGRPSVFYLLDALSAVAETAHAVGDRRLARSAGRQLTAFARAFPIGTPRARLWAGMRHRAAGRGDRAQAAFTAGLQDAVRLGMPRDEALLRAALAAPEGQFGPVGAQTSSSQKRS